MMSFGERLRDLRKNRHLRQVDVAEALSLNQVTYSGYEIGKREPDFEILRKICDIFQCSADYLLGIPTPPVDPVLAAYREAPPVLQAAICDMLHIAPPASSMSSVSTFVPGGGYERKEKSRG